MTDWPLVLAKLRACGYTHAELAAACGISKRAIEDLGRGVTREPRYSVGAILVGLVEIHEQQKQPQETSG